MSEELDLGKLKEQTEAHLQQLQQRSGELTQEAAQIDVAHQQLLGRLRLIQELGGEVPPLEPVVYPGDDENPPS